jgi:hypothetical protein
MPTPEQASYPCRKTYAKPKIGKVPLRPAEAVLGACRTFSGGTMWNGTCSPTFCKPQFS